MKKVITFALTLVLLFTVVAPAFAESQFVEIENDAIRLRDDGEAESYSDTAQDVEVVLNAGDVGYAIKQGPFTTTINSIYVCSLTIHDEQRANAVYGVDAEWPFTLIRLEYTVENESKETAVFPGRSSYILTNMGELVQGRVGARNADEDIPKTIEPGETLTRYLFFVCPETWPEAVSFFSWILPRPVSTSGSAWSYTQGVCVELLETAMS